MLTTGRDVLSFQRSPKRQTGCLHLHTGHIPIAAQSCASQSRRMLPSLGWSWLDPHPIHTHTQKKFKTKTKNHETFFWKNWVHWQLAFCFISRLSWCVSFPSSTSSKVSPMQTQQENSSRCRCYHLWKSGYDYDVCIPGLRVKHFHARHSQPGVQRPGLFHVSELPEAQGLFLILVSPHSKTPPRRTLPLLLPRLQPF